MKSRTVIIYIAATDEETTNQKLRECMHRASTWLSMDWINADTTQQAVDRTVIDQTKPVTISPDEAPGGIVIFTDSLPDSIGIETLQRGLDEGNDATDIIIPSVTDLPVDDVRSTVDAFVNDHCITLHTASDGVTLQAGTPPGGAVLRALTDPGAKAEKHTGGRPPVGMAAEDGFLVPDENFDEVARTLQRWRDSELSKRAAAEQIGCARKTIERAAQRKELYGLV